MDRLEEKDLEIGDHIFVWHCMSHIHHGIYIGDNQVVHFSTPVEHGGKHGSAVELIDLDTFNVDGDVFMYLYEVKEDEMDEYPHGTCTTRESDDVSLVLKRTKEVLKDGFGDYDMIGNNCEDLALYCKTGRKAQTSGQTFAAMRRISLAKQAADQGYRSPLAYAACVIGLFNESDLRREHVREEKQNCLAEKKAVKFKDAEKDEGESNDKEANELKDKETKGTKVEETKQADIETVSQAKEVEAKDSEVKETKDEGEKRDSEKEPGWKQTNEMTNGTEAGGRTGNESNETKNVKSNANNLKEIKDSGKETLMEQRN